MQPRRTFFILITLAVFAGCKTVQNDSANSVYNEELMADNGEPGYITVQHCLISCNEVPRVGAKRSRAEAEQLANNLLEKAKAGEEFGQIVERFTDDSAPGIYKMANHGFESNMNQQIFARDGMVPAFGDVGFPLEVGEIGMAPFDLNTSPFGWHIIKRIK